MIGILTLLLLLGAAMPVFARDADTEEEIFDGVPDDNDGETGPPQVSRPTGTETTDKAPITYSYDEYNDLVIVHLTVSDLLNGTGDLTEAFREAHRKEAKLRIQNSMVTLVLDKEAVRAVLQSNTVPSAKVYRIDEENPSATGNYLLAGYSTEDVLYEISLSGIDLGAGSVMATISYHPENSDDVRVLQIAEDGSCVELDAKCKSKKVYVTLTELSTILITEEPAVGGTGVIPLLRVLFWVLIAASVLLAGLLVFLKWSYA